MVGRRHPYLYLSLLLVKIASTLAEDANCDVSFSGRNYQLGQLYGPHTVSRDYKQTPSVVLQNATFDLCAELEINSADQPWDQCPPGTRACLIQWNQKGNYPDRIDKVVPVATSSKLAAQYASTLTDNNEGLRINWHGDLYPPDVTWKDVQVEQSFEIDILCPPNGGDSTAPTFKSYDGTMLKVEWYHQVVCPEATKPGGGGGGGGRSKGAGVGYFFLVLLLAIFSYFAIGAYYNYNNYGARGWDLVPHRDFWRDVPYLIGDVFSHLCGSIRRGGRGGYVQV